MTYQRRKNCHSQKHFGFVLLLITLCLVVRSNAQTVSENVRSLSADQLTKRSRLATAPVTADEKTPAVTAEDPDPEKAAKVQSQFRVARVPIVGGAELFTIFGRLDGVQAEGRPAPEVPLLSFVRDTLGDDNPENDRLSYVWMLTYTRPTLMKRILSGVPFLYQHVHNQTKSSGPPAPVLDLTNPKRATWNNFFWLGLQTLIFDSYGIPLKAASRSYRQNATEYRDAHVTQALSILNSYERLRQRNRDEREFLAKSQTGDQTEASSARVSLISDVKSPLVSQSLAMITPADMLELRARLILSTRTFGGLYTPHMFGDVVTRHSMNSTDTIGHNWELLRQRAEATGLYFQPLTMPDGTATHALLWISKTDLLTPQEQPYHGRFLNIANPWKDARLRSWKGYSEIRYFDQDNRITTAADPQARAVEMIPLALYGLDHPKIPAVLIDFRDSLNPKGREVSRRVLRDVARNVFSLSSFGNLPYFIGRRTFDFFTGRCGIDLNQPTRLNSYSELKLLLSFNGTLNPKLRSEIERRLEGVSLNPLTNDNQTEVQLARQQYDSLLEFARRPDGLGAKIERDRRAEMTSLKHGPVSRFMFDLGNILTFGHYVHRETATPELTQRLETARIINYHTNFLIAVAKSSPQIEITWDINQVRRSLEVLVNYGSEAGNSTAHVAARIFQRTNDDETRQLSLEALSKINNHTARNELIRLYRDLDPQSPWRTMIAERLRRAVNDDRHVKPAEAKAVLSRVGTQ